MYIRRAVLPASSPEEDAAPASNLVLLPLFGLSVVALILIFFVVRIVKRGFTHFPNLTWLRGKGKGAKGRLGLSSVELLPTSFKSAPTSSSSPFSAAFNLESNAGKNGSSTVLSRSSSLDALPQLSTSSPPPNFTSRRRPEWRAPFSLPAFLNTNNKSTHRRSKSLNSLHDTTSSSTLMSAPPTPPKTLLIDISASNSSPVSTSSDLGTHKLHSASPPLIPGLPIPTSSPVKSKNVIQGWTSDVEGESDDIADIHVTNPLLADLKRSQPAEVHAKQLPDLIPLITYDEPSYPPPPPTPSLVPKQLSTNNPFASLVDSFTAQPFISDRPMVSSLSLSSITPSSPPGIELVPMKSIPVESTANLVDLSDDVVEVDHDTKNTLLSSNAFVDSLITADDESTHDTHVETTINLVEPSEEVSDPFDDSHAVILAADDAWNFDPAPPLVEESGIPTGELFPPIQHSKSAHVSPILASPIDLPSRVEPEEVEAPSLVEPEPLSSNWHWNGENGKRSLPSVPAPPLASECSLVTTSPGEIELDEDANLEKLETGNVLMSFDHAEPVSVDEPGGRSSGFTVELGIDVDKEMDPADTWFTEEPTAVWDASWTGEGVKEGVLLDMGREKGVDDDEVDVPREEHINILDELLVPEEPTAVWDVSWTGEDVKEVVLLDMGRKKGVEDDEVDVLREEHINMLDELQVGPSEPIKIHVFDEMVENLSHQTVREDSEDSAAAISSNDNHDVYETLVSHSNIATPIIHAATPLLSTPETPSTPLPELPSPVPVTSSPILEEYPDPDIMPLPDYPPSIVAFTPISPVPIKPQPRSIQQAQTPTPPESPQPWSNASARPLWSLRATDAPALGLPAAVPPVPEVQVSEEPKLVIEVESKTEEADCVVFVDSVKEATVVERTIDPAIDELPGKLEEESTSTSLQPGLSTSIPGSFPPSPSEIPAAALPADNDVAPPSESSAALTDLGSSSTDLRPRARAVIPTSNRIRTPRSVIDIALAMQLRPGLGAGADPAWMVRFLMAVFGWFAILVTGDL